MNINRHFFRKGLKIIDFINTILNIIHVSTTFQLQLHWIKHLKIIDDIRTTTVERPDLNSFDEIINTNKIAYDFLMKNSTFSRFIYCTKIYSGAYMIVLDLSDF